MLRPPAPSPAAASTPSKLKLATRSQPINGAQSAQKSGMRCVVARTSTAGGSPSTTSAAGRRFPTGSRRRSTAPSTLMSAAIRSAVRRKNVCTAADSSSTLLFCGPLRLDPLQQAHQALLLGWIGNAAQTRAGRATEVEHQMLDRFTHEVVDERLARERRTVGKCLSAPLRYQQTFAREAGHGVHDRRVHDPPCRMELIPDLAHRYPDTIWPPPHGVHDLGREVAEGGPNAGLL